MLCNIIALAGCIITIKHSKRIQKLRERKETKVSKEESRFVEVCLDSKMNVCSAGHSRESKLYNTFGWTRIDILTMLIVCIFLASLSFSLLVEALQTLVHIDHQDTMHLPVPVFILGAVGLVLNGLCYLLIGGYTMHQGSFFHVTSSGDVVLDNISSGDDLKTGSTGLTKMKNDIRHIPENVTEPHFESGQRQGLYEIFRDVCSTLFVMVCAAIIYFSDNEQITKFIDPIISIISCLFLLFMSYPYMRESCLILLQTIPASIDIEQFKTTLLAKFKEIVSVHDLHIWQLTASKYVSTVHIIFHDPLIYAQIIEEVKTFFHEQGITNVTIQPEFKDTNLAPAVRDCYLPCTDIACAEKHCCLRPAKPTQIIVQKDNQKSPEKKNTNQSNGTNLEKSKSAMDINSEKMPKPIGINGTHNTTSDPQLSKTNEDLTTDTNLNNETKTEVENEKVDSK